MRFPRRADKKRKMNLFDRLMCGNSELHEAAYSGDWNSCSLLIDHGMPVDKRNHFGETPLHLASKYAHPHICILLLDKGANPNAKNMFGRRVLDYACVHKNIGWVGVTELLIDYGATN